MVSREGTVQTPEFYGPGERGHVTIQKRELIEDGNGKMKRVSTSTCLRVEDRDGIRSSDMEESM